MLSSDGNEWQNSEALGELSEVLAATGRFDEARHCLDNAKILTERYGYLTGLGVIEGQYGLLALQEGRLGEAEETLLRSLRVHERVGNRWRRAWTYDLLARVQDAMNRTHEAAESRNRAAALYAELAVRY
jgi:tetratricopeptide (TPR) repeat protein